MHTPINPGSSPLRLHGHHNLVPLPINAAVPLHSQRTQQQHPARRCTHVVTAAAATDAPKKQPGAKKKRDHPEVPNLPLVRHAINARLSVLSHPRPPQPKAFQQTVKASFTIMGIGLHTANTGTHDAMAYGNDK